ncbi:hypothetical protein KFE25_012234 [Diacronema lutheri]|uniref:SHOCT domain-containing protein n=1 Tax=Diacronema lutheri TaxID=2081491 RepID=A0A8J6C721_DIALT|nr:hypothetical protein KFE25_012234 [Diacronema lutheri]
MCLLFAAIGLHFVLLLSEAGGSGSNVAQIDLSLRAAGRRADALTTAQALVVFGVPLAFFYLAIFSLFAHAIALYAQRLAERDALAKELLAEELRKPQDAALLRHIDELFRRGQISQEDYVMRRTALLNALQPKPLTVAERLRLVDELRKEGAITEDEYAQKRNDLLNSV